MSDLNQIEEIEKLYAKPKTYKIGKQKVEITIMPLGLKDMGLMNVKEDSPIDEISKNVKTLWALSLDISEDEAAKISLEFMQDLMDAFMDANNFKAEDMKKAGIKDFIEKKKALMQEKKDGERKPDTKA